MSDNDINSNENYSEDLDKKINFVKKVIENKLVFNKPHLVQIKKEKGRTIEFKAQERNFQ